MSHVHKQANIYDSLGGSVWRLRSVAYEKLSSIFCRICPAPCCNHVSWLIEDGKVVHVKNFKERCSSKTITGCKIYKHRPRICSDYKCAFLNAFSRLMSVPEWHIELTWRRYQ